MKMDINSTCRLCLGSYEEFVCIFDEETLDINPEIFELLQFLQIGVSFPHQHHGSRLNIDISSLDSLPRKQIQYHVHEMLREIT